MLYGIFLMFSITVYGFLTYYAQNYKFKMEKDFEKINNLIFLNKELFLKEDSEKITSLSDPSK